MPESASTEFSNSTALEAYRAKLREYSLALVAAQKPIRIIDAIKWDGSIEQEALRTGLRSLPSATPEYYRERRQLGFDPLAKIQEFEELKTAISKNPGRDDELGAILYRNCDNYQSAVRMLMARGTPEFFKHGRELYGSPRDHFDGDRTTIRDLGMLMGEILGGIEDDHLGARYEKNIPAEQVVERLRERFELYFGSDPEMPASVRVMLDDGMLADAAAGSDYVKIKTGVLFSEKEIDLLERHEGWVHVGTTFNGERQSAARWLSKGPPCISAVQEGLAVFMELITFTIYPGRGRKLNDRILACDMAVGGADFVEVCEFYRGQGYSEADCYRNASRIFRGGVVSGGAPFTKDIGYCKGMVMVYNFLRTAIRLGKPMIIPFLFAGKVVLEDVPVLYRKYKEGVIDAPVFLPPQFRDLNGLAMWMAYSNFFNRVNLDQVRAYYGRLIEGC